MKRDLNLFTVNNTSWASMERLDEMRNCLEDPRKVDRLKDCRCVLCFYGSRMTTANCPEYECSICNKTSIWHCGWTPTTCQECAKKNRLCMMCGADVNYKERRKDTWTIKEKHGN